MKKNTKKTEIHEIDLTALNGKKRTSSTAILGVMVFLFAAMTLLMYARNQHDIGALNAQLQNITNQTNQLETWARYFSPAAVKAINDLALQQSNMTGRIMVLELKNGIMPLELVNSTANKH